MLGYQNRETDTESWDWHNEAFWATSWEPSTASLQDLRYDDGEVGVQITNQLNKVGVNSI